MCFLLDFWRLEHVASTQSVGQMKSFRWMIAAAFVALGGCAGGVYETESYPKPTDFPIHGIDVSKFQGEIDWSEVRRSGVKFAWIKATEGANYVDPKFWDNWRQAQEAGVPRGAYLFNYWCRPWQDEMAWFEATVPVDPTALPPVLDAEATPTSKTCRRTLDPAQTVDDMRQMLAEMQRHFGRRPVVYTTVDFYRSILRPAALAEYPIWVRSTKYHPAVKYGARPWHFWQYESDGHVPGIQAKVDRNAFFGNADQWEAFLGPRG
jgi:lysozyme